MIAAICLVLWVVVFIVYYRKRFPNQTRLSLKKFDRFFRAAQALAKIKNESMLEDKNQRNDEGKIKNSSDSTVADGFDSELTPTSVDAKKDNDTTALTKEANLNAEDASPTETLLNSTSVAGISRDVLEYFVRNPVEMRGQSSILKTFHLTSIRSALPSLYQLDDWECLYNLQVSTQNQAQLAFLRRTYHSHKI